MVIQESADAKSGKTVKKSATTSDESATSKENSDVTIGFFRAPVDYHFSGCCEWDLPVMKSIPSDKMTKSDIRFEMAFLKSGDGRIKTLISLQKILDIPKNKIRHVGGSETTTTTTTTTTTSKTATSNVGDISSSSASGGISLLPPGGSSGSGSGVFFS